jgi:uncharacterized YigZ family protein
MKLPYEIKTIDDFKEVSNVINKSNFISQVWPVFTEIQVKEYLVNAKKKYYDASHHCYAFKLADGSIRYSDAGEPNGTAGIRILNAIEHFNLSNQLVIISRVFGGVKLGVGPLGKAYYESAYKLISESEIRTKQLFQKAIISATYENINIIHRILANHSSLIIDTNYPEPIKLICLLKSNEIDSISKKITGLGKSNISIVFIDETVYK